MSSRKLDYQDRCFNKDRIKFQEKMVSLNNWQSCANCVHCKNDKCLLFNAQPPVKIVVCGCEEYQYEIPF